MEKEKQLIEKTEDKTEEEVFFEKFSEFISDNENRFKKAKDFMAKFFNDEFSFAYENVYVKNTTINTISRRWFADAYNFERNLPQTSSKNKKEADAPKVKKFISIEDIKNAMEQLEGRPFKQTYYDKNIISPEQELWKQFLTVWKNEFENLFKGIKREDGIIIMNGYVSTLSEANRLKVFSRKGDDRKKEINVVKNYADASLSIFQMMKYIALDEKGRDKSPGQINTDFYAELDEYAKDFEFIKYYNAFRNFLTKKPFNEDKIKLNFEKGNLLGGWAESPEGNAQYCSYILERNRIFYLGVTDYPNILDVEKTTLAEENINNVYKKMFYKQLKSQTIYGSLYESRYNNKYSEDKKKLLNTEIMRRIKNILNDQIKYFPQLSDFLNKEYPDANTLAKELAEISLYGISFDQYIDVSYVEDVVHKIGSKNRHIYLFKITNSDLKKKGKSQDNIHTLYFNNLFSRENLSSPILKLSGGAEIFLRKATEDLPKRKDNKGKDVTVHKRYGEDKMMFHLPIVMNMGTGKSGKFNQKIKNFLSKNKDINIIGIDRGEKHLLYYSVVNQKGEILDSESLNKINGVNYHEKLVAREKERLESRRSWQQAAKIKDLKKGYISHVIHKICELIIKHNAIIVLEDLNMRFKQIRGGIERSVYQQFEKALIDKLGYLVFKRENDIYAPGGVLNGYQLSAPFVSFEKMGKQTGIIFYTQADYTSVTDPLTGFRKNIYISNSISKEKIKEAIRQFKAIGWDEKEKSYFFTYNPIDFVDEKYKNNTFSKEWTVYAKAPRIRREKEAMGHWTYKEIDLNKEFSELFKIWEFENIYAEDLKYEILRKIEDGEFDGKKRSFYHSFIYLFNLILQLRNSYSKQFKVKEEGEKVIVKEIGEDIDFIASPVKPFFSTLAKNKEGKELSPANFNKFNERVIADNKEKILNDFNGDANGAYNIARKGTMILKAISENQEKPDLYISKYNWDEATAKWAKESSIL